MPAADTSGDHQWYYLTSRGLERCALPQKAVLQMLRPWTENLRVADGASARDGSGYLLVNRLGVLVFQREAQPLVLQDVQLFGDTTADTLVFDGAHVYFSLYRSTFFNKDALVTTARSPQDLNRPYLVRVSPVQQMLYPVVTYGDLQLGDGGEVTGTHFDGSRWLLSVKTTNTEETDFRYLVWQPSDALEALMPVTRSGKITIVDSTEDAYREALSVQPLAAAPERLQSLLSSIPDNFGFGVTCKAASGASPIRFESGEMLTQANAVLADDWICAVFADGTTYFNGALQRHPLVADGANVAFRLPKLPKRYFYTDFCISGDYLAVGWEERDFYKTARSGILVVDLAQVLYNKAPAVLKERVAAEESTSSDEAALVGGDGAAQISDDGVSELATQTDDDAPGTDDDAASADDGAVDDATPLPADDDGASPADGEDTSADESASVARGGTSYCDGALSSMLPGSDGGSMVPLAARTILVDVDGAATSHRG